jgi:hypothetical protein
MVLLGAYVITASWKLGCVEKDSLTMERVSESSIGEGQLGAVKTELNAQLKPD